MNQYLPTPLTALIGRENELASVEALLRKTSTRLVTITGPGGVGKTRLTLEIAHRLNRHFAAGCFWVSLASTQEANDVPAALASALEIQVPADRSALSALCEDFAHRDALLVVDNFEHVSDAAPILAELLQAGTSLRIIATSRSLLNLSGEHRVALGPLALPDELVSPSVLCDLESFSAIGLFLARAHAATGSFSLTPENAEDVIAICRALDGLPLAIELAAARLRHLPLAAIVSRLQDRLGLLVGGPRDHPARHQTLHEAINWSYRLLEPRAQALFRRLAALPGGGALETTHALGFAPSKTEDETLELLATLVDCSLVIRLPDPWDEPRYGMLETIRQCGLWHLRAEGEEHKTFRTLSGCLISLAERARKELGGTNQKHWVDRLEIERDNVRAICEWAIQANDPEIVLRLGNMLWPLWLQRDNLGEGRDLMQRALASPGQANEALRASAVFNLGILSFDLQDYVSARNSFEECRQVWERADHRDGVASAQNGLGLINREAGLYADASTHFLAAAEIWQALDDESGVAIAQLNLGSVALSEGKLQNATTCFSQALAILRQYNDVDRAAYAILRLAETACLDAQLEQAAEFLRECLEIFTRIGDRGGEAEALYVMARHALLMKDEHEALRLFHDSLALRHALAARVGVVECVDGIAAIAAARGNAADAARLLSATETYRRRIGAVAPSFERQVIEAAWATVNARLEARQIDEARHAGATMSLDETTLDALRLLERPAAATPLDVLEKLSARERDVFALVSAYMTDREIAERLFLSHRTVERHVGSILAKLEVKNRREAAALGSLRRAS